MGCDRHLLFIDVEVLVHELQGLLAAGEGQRVRAQDGPVLVHGSHVLGSLVTLSRAALLGLGPQGSHAAAAEEKSELTAGSRHNADHQSRTQWGKEKTAESRIPPRLGLAQL